MFFELKGSPGDIEAVVTGLRDRGFSVCEYERGYCATW